MAKPVNQHIADALTEQQLKASRVEAGLRREAWAVQALLEADILAVLKVADPTQSVLLARRRREVEVLMREAIDPLIQARYAQLATMLDEALMRLARHEAGLVQQVVNDATDEETITDLPSERRLRAGVVHGLFPSAATPTDLSTTGRDWWQRQADGLSQRLGDQLTVSVSLEESLTQMTTRVRGTSEQGFQDGVMARARHDARRLLTTQTTNAVSEARVAVAERNAAQLVLVHRSLRDGKTSVLCIARDGKRFTADAAHTPIGHELPFLQGVPYHPHCRSEIHTILAGGGAVAQESMAQWLTRRGPAFQDTVLGPTRARMWREGKLGSLRNLLDALTGKPLTLEELGA